MALMTMYCFIALALRGVPRGGVCADSTTRILEAHRALTMWDGRGGACGFNCYSHAPVASRI